MHSKVREQARIDFDGAAYGQDFVLADVHMQWPLSRKEVTLFYSPDGLVVVAPLPDDQSSDRYRIVATVDQAPESPTSDYVQSVLDRRGPTADPGRIHDIVWSSRFHVHHRIAKSPRKGRILLCGDAAHVHSPAGGQGMNTGIQDAASLARVLTEVLRDGDEARVDVWASERHRVARDVVTMTGQNDQDRHDEVGARTDAEKRCGCVRGSFASGAGVPGPNSGGARRQVVIKVVAVSKPAERTAAPRHDTAATASFEHPSKKERSKP